MNLSVKSKTYDVEVAWLASHAGKMVKTGGITLNDTGITANDEGRKVIPSGSFVGVSKTNAPEWEKYDGQATPNVETTDAKYGILIDDVDVTDGPSVGAVLFGGKVMKDRLPVTPDAATVTALKLVLFV